MRLVLGALMVVLAATLGSPGVSADTFDRNSENCKLWETRPDTAINACTWLMGSGVLDADSLPDVYAMRGLAYGRTGRYRDAINDLNTAIRWEPEVPYFYYARGSAYMALGEADLAEYDYGQAIRLAPKDYAFLNPLIGGQPAVGAQADD